MRKQAVTFVILASFLLFAGMLFFFASTGHTQTLPLPSLPVASTSSDFMTAVQAGMRATASSPALQAEQQQIQGQDYKSTWDEFGINVMVDGAAPAAEVDRQVVGDIAQSVDVAQKYDQEEADYLQAQQMTPEEVQSAEQSVGIDLPSGEQLDANPSIEANPDAGVSSSDTTTITTITTTTDTTSGTEGEMNDSMIFDAILKGEQAQPVSSTEMDVATTTAPDAASSSDAAASTSATSSDAVPPPETTPPVQ